MTFQDYLDTSISVPRLDDITPELISELGLKALVIDFDGVLGGARSEHCAEQYRDWLIARLKEGLHLAVHSNNPESVGQDRRQRFLHDFPDILWMPTHPRKPSPSTLQYLKQRWQLDGQQIAMIDDRMLTGGLAAHRASVRFIWVRDAIADYGLAPMLEMGFAGLRLWERCLYRGPEIWCTREDSNL